MFADASRYEHSWAPARGLSGRATHKRGRRGPAAESMRKARRSTRRAEARRLKRRFWALWSGPDGGRREGSGARISSRASGPLPERGGQGVLHQEADLAGPLRRRAGFKVDYGQELTFATLSVQSICKPLMHAQVVQYMNDRRIGLLCVQETKAPGLTQYVVDDKLFIMSGAQEAQREHAGVGIVLQRDVRRALTGVLVVPGGRVIAVCLDLAPRALAVICVYAPQGARPEPERVEFYEELSALVAKVQRKHAVVLLGDFNARIQGRRRGEDAFLGPHIYGSGVQQLMHPPRGHGERSNRDLLMEMCMTRREGGMSWHGAAQDRSGEGQDRDRHAVCVQQRVATSCPGRAHNGNGRKELSWHGGGRRQTRGGWNLRSGRSGWVQ